MFFTIYSQVHGKIKVYYDREDAGIIKAHKWRVTQVRPNGCKYIIADIDGKTKYLHRVILGAVSGEYIDHINRNTFDNRKKNLRKCTVQENQRNRNKIVGKSSVYIGVSWNKAARRWVSGIVGDDKRRKHLGYFGNEKAAALAYDQHAKILHGKFANLNFK